MIALPVTGTVLNYACAICQAPIVCEYRLLRTPSAFCRSCTMKIVRRRKQWGARHNESRTKLYRVYCAMKARCLNPTNAGYPGYGGRGIYVCTLWLADYRHFAQWARANGYRDGVQLDRVDNDGPYSPDNCRWTTAKEQAANKRPKPGYFSLIQAQVIRREAAAGASRTELAAKYQVPPKRIKKILRGETFAVSA